MKKNLYEEIKRMSVLMGLKEDVGTEELEGASTEELEGASTEELEDADKFFGSAAPPSIYTILKSLGRFLDREGTEYCERTLTRNMGESWELTIEKYVDRLLSAGDDVSKLELKQWARGLFDASESVAQRWYNNHINDIEAMVNVRLTKQRATNPNFTREQAIDDIINLWKHNYGDNLANAIEKKYYPSGRPTPSPNTNTNTTTGIPDELDNIDKVKRFQDWMNDNKPGWLKGGNLPKNSKAYGKAGPSTLNAWAANGAKYKSTPEELMTTRKIEDFQDWLDLNHPDWYNGGTLSMSKASGYGRYGPLTEKMWKDHQEVYLADMATKLVQREKELLDATKKGWRAFLNQIVKFMNTSAHESMMRIMLSSRKTMDQLQREFIDIAKVAEVKLNDNLDIEPELKLMGDILAASRKNYEIQPKLILQEWMDNPDFPRSIRNYVDAQYVVNPNAFKEMYDKLLNANGGLMQYYTTTWNAFLKLWPLGIYKRVIKDGTGTKIVNKFRPATKEFYVRWANMLTVLDPRISEEALSDMLAAGFNTAVAREIVGRLIVHTYVWPMFLALFAEPGRLVLQGLESAYNISKGTDQNWINFNEDKEKFGFDVIGKDIAQVYKKQLPSSWWKFWEGIPLNQTLLDELWDNIIAKLATIKSRESEYKELAQAEYDEIRRLFDEKIESADAYVDKMSEPQKTIAKEYVKRWKKEAKELKDKLDAQINEYQKKIESYGCNKYESFILWWKMEQLKGSFPDKTANDAPTSGAIQFTPEDQTQNPVYPAIIRWVGDGWYECTGMGNWKKIKDDTQPK